MKFRYKILIVFAVFIAAMIFFNSNIKETFFSTAAETTLMSDPTLPTISIDVNGNEINRLHGYVSNLDEMIMRETITPITSDRVFTVLIDENESNVKKLKYEILNADGREVESDSFTVLDVDNGPKKVRISLKETMKSGQEYVCKITLITNQSKRIYYYTRLKMYDDGHLYEKLQFALDFRKTLLGHDEPAKEALQKYLESSKASDNTSFASVNIKSSFEMVSWGNLEPELIWDELPTVTEFYDSMASVELKYIVGVEMDGGTEYYVVKEHFRFNYTERRTYLYNYERTMEAVYDVSNTSLTKDEFKLGITNDVNAQTGASPSKKFLSFVYGRQLMLYDVDANDMIIVFSFRQNSGDYSRDYYDQHDVKLVNVYDNGNVDFMVYGYMNRGEYEGRVGMVLYRYIKEDNRIEELIYIPINSSYQLLAADMTDFAFLGERDVFYFSLYDSIYSYDLTSKKLNVLAENVPKEKLFYCEEESYITWQDNPDDKEAKTIYVLNLLSGDIHAITTSEGETIRLYGRINNNIVYGFAYQSDISILTDGSTLLPTYKLCIEDGYGNILKTYREYGYYINEIEVGDNIITLKRLTRKSENPVTYVEASEDSILNRYVEEVKPVYLTKRVTDRILTEYYVSIPSNIDLTEIPVLVKALNTVINYETTTRVSEPENRTGQFYAYSFGRVVYADPSPALTVIAADEMVGTVIDSEGRIVWERGVKATRAEISGIKTVAADENHDSIQAAMKMLLLYKNLDIDTADYDRNKTEVSEWLAANMKSEVLNLTGATLDEVLYYVYKSKPVFAIGAKGNACVITAYDAAAVTVYEPAKKKSMKYSLKDAATMFEEQGSIFITYID